MRMSGFCNHQPGPGLPFLVTQLTTNSIGISTRGAKEEANDTLTHAINDGKLQYLDI